MSWRDLLGSKDRSDLEMMQRPWIEDAENDRLAYLRSVALLDVADELVPFETWAAAHLGAAHRDKYTLCEWVEHLVMTRVLTPAEEGSIRQMFIHGLRF